MKERVCITLDNELLDRAKDQKINISATCEAALLRELEIFEKSSYGKALEAQNTSLKAFINSKKLANEWEDFKLGVVLQEERVR
jgi:post-segregation antitoxin (ccd killing protein)